jgi:hypothetical protein
VKERCLAKWVSSQSRASSLIRGACTRSGGISGLKICEIFFFIVPYLRDLVALATKPALINTTLLNIGAK